jgi:hypothetical protein
MREYLGIASSGDLFVKYAGGRRVADMHRGRDERALFAQRNRNGGCVMFGSTLNKIKRWIFEEGKEVRHAERFKEPEIVVHYWDGSSAEGRPLRDISQTGAYIYTPERWYLGTIVRLILQEDGTAASKNGGGASEASICIRARVVRHGTDGVAVEFALRDKEEEATLRKFLATIPSPKASTPPAAGLPVSIPGFKQG